ncbi:MAG: hypothetical protein KDC66_00965 [Phaeodactylibacter sp.]|nr:hypothetical protein [Phaeodactylibacter sp.]MCB9276878.1 hypothetical protein [Lewinellaceae bacterium]
MLSDLFFKPEPESQYSALNATRIRGTLERLTHRITERFPGSGLSQVSAGLQDVASRIESLCIWLSHPLWPIRALAILAGLAVLGIFSLAIMMTLNAGPQASSVSDLLQGIESAINEIIFLSIALYFLSTLEGRIKRRAALKALHRLRSIAHVVDMHQLSKDPNYVLTESTPTASSPERQFTSFELARYLDYCSELLSITSKLAALHAQYLNDPVVLNAVDDVEGLAHSLAAKIWQKIMILDLAVQKPDSTQRNDSPGGLTTAH